MLHAWAELLNLSTKRFHSIELSKRPRQHVQLNQRRNRADTEYFHLPRRFGNRISYPRGGVFYEAFPDTC
jgi:hypothetical protein